jgi:hypothetical protein
MQGAYKMLLFAMPLLNLIDRSLPMDINEAITWFDDLSPHLQMDGRIAWQTLKSAVLAAQPTNNAVEKFTSTNSRVMQLLCDVKTLLLDVDTPTREQRSNIVHRIAQLP